MRSQERRQRFAHGVYIEAEWNLMVVPFGENIDGATMQNGVPVSFPAGMANGIKFFGHVIDTVQVDVVGKVRSQCFQQLPDRYFHRCAHAGHLAAGMHAFIRSPATFGRSSRISQQRKGIVHGTLNRTEARLELPSSKVRSVVAKNQSQGSHETGFIAF